MQRTSYYEPVCDVPGLFSGFGHIAIITGWTNASHIASKLRKQISTGAIGNLYSHTPGIDILLRNLLANPQITDVVALRATKQDNIAQSVDMLEQFWLHGLLKHSDKAGHKLIATGEGNWPKAYVQDNLPSDALDLLRKKVQLHVFGNERAMLEHIAFLSLKWVALKKPVREALHIARQAEQATGYGKAYGQAIGTHIEATSIAEAHTKLVQRINQFGTDAGDVRELIACNMLVHEPWHKPADCLSGYENSLLQCAPPEPGISYTYGHRIGAQLMPVLRKLSSKLDASNRHGVVTIWQPGDSDLDSPPCMTQLQAKVLPDGKLMLIAHFRSNDAMAWPSNAYALAMLQEHMANKLGLKSGPLYTFATSMHIYG